ncbi:conserved hypothetical protein [Nostocoides japonicum T1-X7]|uniref:Transglutaminase-like domain-containing protein n=1 Tax=Nostocoides japonicum T1-X7 TaxID=1194083 RepID=A0A077M1T2_9MICO|nr:transglutaminase-like domain-containing protein [Tetrasphaera japonica]CCH80278.1 conserved hypothetical protein [Tetrasphaera japonica T1-X7]
MSPVPDPASHTAYSDPGPWAGRLRELPDDVESLCAASRNVIVHYRAELPEMTPDRLPEVNSRWLHRILERDQRRFATPLLAERPPTERVAGCCRDHSLFLTAALRERGIRARNRVGFARYLSADWVFDHVVTEYHDGDRWVRTDPEFAAGQLAVDVRDLGRGPDSPFRTAAETWLAHRDGTLDVGDHGVFPGAGPDLRGPGFVRHYVVMQLAHRYGDELLLWDTWGAIAPDGPALSDEEVDDIARRLVAADADVESPASRAADEELYAVYRSDARLRPGAVIRQLSPLGTESQVVDLTDDGRPRG